MALFLSPYIGQGTKADPFRPRGLDQPGSSAIDIRLDPTKADGGGIGYAMLWVPLGIPDPLGAIRLADDYDDRLTSLQRQRLNMRTGLDFSADLTIQDAVETIMLRPDLDGWHRLRPTKGRLEVWLGSGNGKRRWIDAPVIAGGSISDNFNRANETPIAAPWQILAGSSGSVNLTSNAITHAVSSGILFLSYNHATGWTADQSAKFKYASSTVEDDWGPAVRIGVTGVSGYFLGLWSPGPAVYKSISGATSEVEAVTLTGTVGNTYKIDVAGSTIRYYENDVELSTSPATDTSLTTAGVGAGAYLYSTGGSIDDFISTGEIASGGGSLSYQPHPMRHLVIR